MLSWFSKRCPVSTWEQAWIEMRYSWLVKQLGFERIRAARAILPDEVMFAADGSVDEAELRDLVDDIGKVMGIGTLGLNIEVCDDEQLPNVAGHYDTDISDTNTGPTIRVARSLLGRHAGLVVTLAHELSHHLLLSNHLIPPETEDHELVTDLVPTVLGLGLIQANATIEERHVRYGEYYSWKVQRHGYLPSHMIGYALAVWSHSRDESAATLDRWLRHDAAVAYRRGLKYVRDSKDCLIQPESIGDLYRSRVASTSRT